jgi:hypothetical protein
MYRPAKADLAAMLGLVCILGCGGGIERQRVSGTVTFDGQPVERGEVSFVPEDRGQSPEGGVIQDGKFSFEAVAGKKTVRIRGSRRLPPQPDDDPDSGPLYEDFIPAKYNTDSTLKVEVTSAGPNVFPFELTSR